MRFTSAVEYDRGNWSSFANSFCHLCAIAYSRALVNRHNHFGHDGTHDPEVMHIFDGNVSLFLDDSSQERIKVNKTGLYWITRWYKELSRKASKSRAPRLREFLVEGVPDECWEESSEHPTSPRQVGINIRELTKSAIHRGVPDRGREKGKKPLHVPAPLPSLKKQWLASHKPGPVPRDSSRTREESPAVPVQKPRIGSSGKEPIPLEDKEEQVDYGHDNTDSYLTDPEDACNLGDIGDSNDESDFRVVGKAMLTPFPTSGGFGLVTDFEGTSGIEREGLQSPKPCSDEGPSEVIATLGEPEVSSMDVEVVPTDVPMTTVMVART
ncbi:uncharacterized protein A4U43_C03F25560 [Asparagus officinalis]|uniref:Uncharacterized protein n=1 Tax=Asparagus officinalis TaxID=4686 RepID=A0A5P1FCW1_ASPOF|nr:uncharacterized protein A4U43_C03F25560 [Asparagus officinalis]